MIRKAVAADVPEIERVMRASMAVLGTNVYDAAQVASAVRYIAVVDRQLIDDGTYFVIEEEGRVVACGGWSGRAKLFSGPSSQDAVEGRLDPATDSARIRAMFVDPVFQNPAAFKTGAVWMAFLAYALQIYCDFSGYSDIARGISRISWCRSSWSSATPCRRPSPARSAGGWWRRTLWSPPHERRVRA